MLNKYPEEINFKKDIIMMDCGDLLTIFLSKDGTVYTYGENIGKESLSTNVKMDNWELDFTM
jgi:alpha-tubulin suppressor-like RCC1 family protein